MSTKIVLRNSNAIRTYPSTKTQRLHNILKDKIPAGTALWAITTIKRRKRLRQSLEDADVIMLFPNTQDGYWINNPSAARRTAGVDRLTAVKLMYYPHIADGSREDATTVFPAGYKVGLVIANNAWSNRVSGFDDDSATVPPLPRIKR